MPFEQPQKRIPNPEPTGGEFVYVNDDRYRRFDFDVQLSGRSKPDKLSVWARDPGSALAEIHLHLQVDLALKPDMYQVLEGSSNRGVHYSEKLSNPQLWEIGIPEKCGCYLTALSKLHRGAAALDPDPALINRFEDCWWKILYHFKWTKAQEEALEDVLLVVEKQLGPKEIIQRFGPPDPINHEWMSLYGPFIDASKRLNLSHV